MLEKELNKYAVYRYVTDIERTYIKAKTIEEAYKLALNNTDHNGEEILYWKNLGAGTEDKIPIEEIELVSKINTSCGIYKCKEERNKREDN